MHKTQSGAVSLWAPSDGFVAAVFARARIGIAFLDSDRRFSYLNDMLAEMNGSPAVDHLGRTVEDVVPDLALQLNEVLDRVLTGERVVFEQTG